MSKEKLNEISFLPLYLQLIRSDGYWSVSKLLVNYFKSIEKALFLSEIIAKENFFRERNQLKDNKWFFLTYDRIRETTFLSVNKQRRFVKELVKENIISIKTMGIPSKQYYCINKAIFINLINFKHTFLKT